MFVNDLIKTNVKNSYTTLTFTNQQQRRAKDNQKVIILVR